MLDQLYSQKNIPKGQIRPAVHNGQNNTDSRSEHTSTPFPQSQNAQIRKVALSQEHVPENPFKGELIKTSTTDSNKKLATEETTQQQNINENDQSFGFFDFLDVINPLQHIPVISTLYREITGDEIQPAARVVGGMIYGGPSGFISAIANSISEETTGKDIGENILEAFLGSDEEETPVQVAAVDPLSEKTPPHLFSQLAPVIPPAPLPASGQQPQTNNALNTSAAPSPLEGKAALAALYDDITSTTTATHPIQASSNSPSNSDLMIQQAASEPLPPSKPGKWFPLSGSNVLIAQASHSPQPIPTKTRTQQITPAITASATNNLPSAEETIAAIESDFATNLLNGLDKYQELKSNN
ncbi:hypothetical protein [Kiloniella litopenaei]|uniref:hypothetical protein n=1 Tax=Kiloniella litopenaei TaxID=1549748 RepID=UPI003BA9B771